MTLNYYDAVKRSLYHFCDTQSHIMATDGTNPNGPMALYNFDAFSQQNTLPAGDLIGPYQYSLEVDDELVTVKCMIGIATDADTNLFRLDACIGKLMVSLLPGAMIPVYDPATFAGNGSDTAIFQLKVKNGTSASPVYTAVQRPLKLIHFTAGASRALQRP